MHASTVRTPYHAAYLIQLFGTVTPITGFVLSNFCFIGRQLLQGLFIQDVSVSSSFPLFHYAFYAGSDQSTCSVVAGLPACA